MRHVRPRPWSQTATRPPATATTSPLTKPSVSRRSAWCRSAPSHNRRPDLHAAYSSGQSAESQALGHPSVTHSPSMHTPAAEFTRSAVELRFLCATRGGIRIAFSHRSTHLGCGRTRQCKFPRRRTWYLAWQGVQRGRFSIPHPPSASRGLQVHSFPSSQAGSWTQASALPSPEASDGTAASSRASASAAASAASAGASSIGIAPSPASSPPSTPNSPSVGTTASAASPPSTAPSCGTWASPAEWPSMRASRGSTPPSSADEEAPSPSHPHNPTNNTPTHT
jgi:hypothetical protein